MRTKGLHSVDDYRIRFLACLAASLVISLTTIHVWPASQEEPERRPVYHVSEHEAIRIDDVQPTRQAETAPPPPSPPIPILVPNEFELEDVDLDFTDNLLPIDEPANDLLASEGDAEETSQPSGPTVGPRTVRFVEPEYTREARRRRIRAELVVRVLVDERGRVEEATVVERFLLDDDGTSRRPVDELGYGLEEAALSAADRWMFRPAQRDGQAVASHTELTFTFGIDA